MSIKHLTDKKGNPFIVLNVDGTWFPCDHSPATIRNVPNLEIRDDDIIICGYLRSGTHWVFEMANMLLKAKAETIPYWKGKQSLEFTPETELNSFPSPRVLNTHLHYEFLPDELKRKGNKIIYVIRDPRDIAVSYYNLYAYIWPAFEYKGTWEDWLPLYLEGSVGWGSWFEHIKNYEKVFAEKPEIPVHFMYYEETKQNPLLAVQQLSDFLGLIRNEELCQTIADKCSFEKMKKDKDPYTYKPEGRPVFYRKGIVGDWKNWFTVTQKEEFDRVFKEKISESKMVKRYMFS